MNRLILAAVLLAGTAFASLPAKADVTLGGFGWTFNGVNTLTLSEAVPEGNQVRNLPCIICGENQPLQPTGFGYNDFGNTGNQTNLLYFSSGVVRDSLGSDTLGVTNYSGAFLATYLESANALDLQFSIGIDVNDTNERQTLESFFFLDVTTKTVLAAFINTTEGNLLSPNNGTGFPDMTLSGFSLAGLDLTHQYAFFSRISGANDGPDSFFLQAVAVPGPLAGAGIPGIIAACGMMIGFAKRRRQRNLTA